MMPGRFRYPRAVLAGVALVLCAAAAAITITPAQHDFGQATVGGSPYQTFQVTVPLAAGPLDTMRIYLTGNNPIDFNFGTATVPGMTPGTQHNCDSGEPWPAQAALVAPRGKCKIDVAFIPLSLGIKTATLVVTDNRGNRGTVSLRGEGVGVLCTMKVVPCNYAHLYSGSFIWSSALTGQYGRTTVNVTVTVIKGVATCNGAQHESHPGGSITGGITGTGLFAVEFDEDDQGRQVYNITAACPSPDHPDMGAGRPADLGNLAQQSYPQLVPASAQQQISRHGVNFVALDLIGSHSYPDPATDPDNGVSGIVRVRWDLKRVP